MYSIDEGLASIKECLEPGAPEPGSQITEMGLSAIRECLYGAPEPSDIKPVKIEEAAEILANWLCDNDDPIVQEAMTTINSILGTPINEAAEIKEVIIEAAEVFQEGLINFKINSVETLKKAIDKVEATPKTSKWFLGILTACTILYTAAVTVGTSMTTSSSVITALSVGMGSLASLGIGALVAAIGAGAAHIGVKVLDWVVTKVFNKITNSNQISPSEKIEAIKKIFNILDKAEQRCKKNHDNDKLKHIVEMKKEFTDKYKKLVKQDKFVSDYGKGVGAAASIIAGGGIAGAGAARIGFKKAYRDYIYGKNM